MSNGGPEGAGPISAGATADHQPRPRRSREELRAMLVEAGRAILSDEGFGAGAGSLTFKRVFERVESDTGIHLTNASVIRRIWENQAEYQVDVLTAIASDDGVGEYADTVATLTPVLAALDLGSVEARALALREVCRVGGEANGRALRDSKNWSLWMGVWALATVTELPENRQQVHRALFEGYESTTELWQDTYGALLAYLGYRVRPAVTLRQFTIAVGALVEGCTLRQRVDQSFDGIMLPTGPDGALQEWTLFAVGLEALATRFFEPDPEWLPGGPGRAGA